MSSLEPAEQKFFLSRTLSRSQHSCHWFRITLEYTAWLEVEGTSLLCVTAGAGRGKTTLTAHVSQWVASDTKSVVAGTQDQSRKTNPPKPMVLVFFFQKANQETTGNASAALRSIITQLVKGFPDLISVAIKRYEALSTRGNFQWTWENLWDIFLQMLEKVPTGVTVYLILDAMDECDNDSRRTLLNYLHILAGDSLLQVPLVGDIPPLKILITSRPDGHIIDGLPLFTNLEIKDSHTSTDIENFIDDWVSSFSKRRHLGSEIAQRIGQFLLENARGMFLWVVLIVEELERRDERLTSDSIGSRLCSIPLTLVNTYESILLRPPNTRKRDMWRILRWLLYGQRGLTVPELETALCLETATWLDFAGDLQFLCGSLVRFDGTRGEINLVHQTARDFLESFVKTASHDQLGDIPMESTAAHTHLAEICVKFLLRSDTFLELEQALLSVKVQVDYLHVVAAFLRRYPFICYSVENWAAHIRAISHPLPPLSSAIRQLLGSQLHRDGIMTLEYYIRHYGSPFVPRGASALHLAAYYDFAWLVGEYIAEPEIFIDILPIMNDSPLIWACETGGTASVKKLLAAGADPNVREADGWTALHWAARNGHLRAVELLLDHGARISWSDSEGLTALEWAARGGYWTVFDLIAKKQEVSDDNEADLAMAISVTARSLTSKFEGSCSSLSRVDLCHIDPDVGGDQTKIWTAVVVPLMVSAELLA
jgi:hypothetical protein